MDIRCNQQTLLNIDINLRRGRGEIDAEAYYRAMRGALELSMPELVTDEPEARELMTRLRKCVNNRQAEEAARLTARYSAFDRSL